VQRAGCLLLPGAMSLHLQPLFISHSILLKCIQSLSHISFDNIVSCNSASCSKKLSDRMCHRNQELSRTERGKSLLWIKRAKLYQILHAHTLCTNLLYFRSNFETFCTGHCQQASYKKYLYSLHDVLTRSNMEKKTHKKHIFE